MSDSETEFTLTYQVSDNKEVIVRVDKVGGGTLGKAYIGSWDCTLDDGKYRHKVPLFSGQPKTHEDMANLVISLNVAVDPYWEGKGLYK